jgi:hypothetical protein
MGTSDRSIELKWIQAMWLATLWVGTVMLPTIPLVVMLVHNVILVSGYHDVAVMADLAIVNGRENVDTWKPITVGLPVILFALLLAVPLASALAHRSWKVAALSVVFIVVTAATVVCIVYAVCCLPLVSATSDALEIM